MMKTVLAAAFAASCLVGAAAQGADTLRVGMSGGYFPFTFVRQDKLQGFEVDVMNAVGKHAGLDVVFETMSFSSLIGALDAGRIDTIANQITITPEREAAFAFTQAYVIDGVQVVTKKGNDAVSGVYDLRGKTVAVNLGSNFEQLLRDLPFANEIDIRTYESNIEQDTALDPEWVGEVLDLLRRVAERRQTMLIVTHEMQFAREIADRIVFMDAGRIIEQGPPGQVLDAPEDNRLKLFLRRVA